MFKYKKYNLLIQLNSGAIGDFIMMVDMAIRAHDASGAKTIIVLKGNVSFLKTFLACYPYITALPYTPKTFLHLIILAYTKQACILWETANIGYKRRVLWFLKFFYYLTPTRVVALQVQNEFSFLKQDAIPFLNDRKIYLIGVQMLRHIGLSVNENPPHIDFIPDEGILGLHGLSPLEYIVVCPTTSGFSEIQRSWPDKRWAHLITETFAGAPLSTVVFVGGPGDRDRFLSIMAHVNKKQEPKTVIFDGTLNAQQMMTIFSNAKLFFGVRTGTTAVASCISSLMPGPQKPFGIMGTINEYIFS